MATQKPDADPDDTPEETVPLVGIREADDQEEAARGKGAQASARKAAADTAGAEAVFKKVEDAPMKAGTDVGKGPSVGNDSSSSEEYPY
jgi:hypothetical protein